MNIQKNLKVFGLFLFLFFCSINVFALENLKIVDVKVKDQSLENEIEDIEVHDNSVVLTPVYLSGEKDYLTFEVTVNNSDNDNYQLVSVNSTLKDSISVKSDEIGKIKKGGDSKYAVTLTYDKRMSNQSLNDQVIRLNYANNINPFTGNYFLCYLILILFLIGFIFGVLLKNKKALLLLFTIFIIPIFVSAENQKTLSLTIKTIMIDNKYKIIVMDGNEEVGTYYIREGDPISTIPEIEKEGYIFEGLISEDETEINPDYAVTSDMTLELILVPIEYPITYDLSGGTVENNPPYYTIEDRIVLNNPTKIDNIFIGWQEEGSVEVLENLVIPKGTTGPKKYTAIFQSTIANYTVIHKQMDLNGVYQEFEREELTGTIGSDIQAPVKTYTGFTSPAAQTKTINEDGSTTFVYNYERKKYTLKYANPTYIESTSHPEGSYYYGTQITVTAVPEGGYDTYFNANEHFYRTRVCIGSNCKSFFTLTATFTLEGNTSVVVNFCLSGDMIVDVYDKKKKKKKKKKLKDVTLDDLLLAWDFDNGCLDYVEPSFIMKVGKAQEHHLLRFDDGSVLDVVGEHRMYDVDRELFVDCIADSPIGTRTITSEGKIIKLISKQTVESEVDVCRVITKKHFNLYANGILTSIVFNNLYPIKDMKYVKEERNAIHLEDLDVDEYTFDALRFSEVDENFKDYLESTQSFLNYYSGVLNNGQYEKNDK